MSIVISKDESLWRFFVLRVDKIRFGLRVILRIAYPELIWAFQYSRVMH